jgi:hypothetical protein
MGGSTKQTTKPVFYETWFPGQKEYMEKFLQPMKDIYGGNYNTPQAQMMAQIIGEEAGKETAKQKSEIAGTRGMSTPGKAQAISKVGAGAVTAQAEVPKTIWEMASKVLGQYALTPPSVSTGEKGKSSGWNLFCWVWTYFNGKNGEDTNLVRAYRDSHFGRYANVAQGYREMGKVMLPLLEKSPIVRVMVYYSIYKPITAIARGSHNPIILGVGYLWKFIFQGIGMRARAHLSKKGIPIVNR